MMNVNILNQLFKVNEVSIDQICEGITINKVLYEKDCRKR